MIHPTIPVIQCFHDVSQHCAVLASASSYSNIVSWSEEVGLADGEVNLSLKSKIETLLAQRVSSLGSLEDCSLATICTALHWHLLPSFEVIMVRTLAASFAR